MRNKSILIIYLILCLSLLVGCNQETNGNEGDTSTENKTEEKGVETDKEEDKEQSETKKEGAVESEEPSGQPLESTNQTEKTDSEENEINNDDLNLGDYNVFLGGEMMETEDKIVIEGKSNLLPESRIVGEVSVADDKYLADTTEIVKDDGTFHMEIANHDLSEETNAIIKFDFDGQQDDAIKRHYGERGQKLEGNYIYKFKGKIGGGDPQNIYNTAMAEISFKPSEEMAIRQFKEPSWYSIPEDMGDPRVWMEIDEIKNDENYFYLHGRSNLLEGSELKGSYGNNHTKASVKRDGSFDMVFDYEYKEETSFVIEFDPSQFQWNIIEETYGAKGQKLVGIDTHNSSFSSAYIIFSLYDPYLYEQRVILIG